MNRFLKFAIPLALAAGIFGLPANGSMIATNPAEASSEVSPTPSYGCCWIFYQGKWYCVPC